MSFVSPTVPLPLESLNLAILPKTTHNITWSPDSELAVGCDDCVLVYVPEFSRIPAPINGGRYDAGPRQYDEAALRFPIAPLKSPDLNRHLFDQAGQEFAGYASFTGAGSGIITGHGSTLNHTVALAWSPCGLGRMNRAVLAVLTAAGIVTVYCQGASEVVGGAVGRNARSLRPWVPAWHVGGGLLVPTDGHPSTGKKECITAFSWARDAHAGVAIMSYVNDEHEIVLLLVRATHHAKAAPGHPGTWTVREVARFMAEGPHPTPADPTDPDYANCSSSFALSWSPWLKRGGSRTSIVSYVAHNHIGFRQVTLDDPEEGHHEHDLPSVHVARADTSGVCLYLSTDAFVVWEDKIWTVPGTNICRGVIASPTKVQAFELPFDHTSPIAKHSTEECGTTYPSEEDMVHMENPITGIGLIIHPPTFSNSTATPSYTLVRLSATHDNPAWHQTNLVLPPNSDPDGDDNDDNEDDDPTNLQWATDISQIIEHQLPRALAHRQGGNAEKGRGDTGFESDADDDDESDELEDYSDSDFDSEDDNSSKAAFPGIFRGVDTEDQVHLYRVRIWGLTASPGGGTSAVLVSLHSNLELERDTFAGLNCRVLFATTPRVDLGDYVPPGTEILSTEAHAWEWMYGAAPPVPGYSALAVPNRNKSATLRDHFRFIARSLRCVFCECPLASENNSSWCDNGHSFENCANTGVPIVAPNVSHTCGVCGLKSLKFEELLNLAPYLEEVAKEDISAELCGRCGGKFTN
ncbi:hypothetical protein F4801DRAFT_158622 [Xylaria longipes]|nr:hypothetical protein F4801DRAFT_158622 [Xylaria longipes]